MNDELRNINIPELRFSEFTEDWEEKTLGNVLKITSAARVHKDEWTEKGVPFFRSSDVVANFKGRKNTKAYIPLELYISLSDKIGRVKKDDLLVTGGGSIGIPFLMKNNDPLYFKDADLLWIKNTNDISGYFLYSFFLTQSFKKYLKSISHVGTIAHYTVNQVKSTPCHFPTPTEQTKIATFLTAMDKRISLLQKKKAELAQYKKGVMQKLFSQTLRFKNDDGDDFGDWEEKKLGEVCEIKAGGDIRKLNFSKLKTDIHKYPVYANALSNESLYGYSEKPKIKSDCVTVTGRGDVGYAFERKANFTPVVRLLTLIANIPMSTYFLKTAINLMNIHIESTGVPQLTSSQLSAYKVLFPEPKEQQKIANFLSSIDKSIDNIANQIDDSVVFKKGLLQKMFV